MEALVPPATTFLPTFNFVQRVINDCVILGTKLFYFSKRQDLISMNFIFEKLTRNRNRDNNQFVAIFPFRIPKNQYSSKIHNGYNISVIDFCK